MAGELTLNLNGIPEYLKTRKEPRWTVFYVPGDIDDKTGKYKKLIKNFDGTDIRKDEKVRKGFFSDVIKTVDIGMGKYVPAYWIDKSDGLLFLDIDTRDKNQWLDLNTFTETSISGGFHALCWYSGKDITNHIGNIELYRGGRWIAITGNVVSGKCDINDLTDDIQGRFDIQILDTIEKQPYSAPEKVSLGTRHTETVKLVGKLYSSKLPFASILAAVREMNRVRFDPPWSEHEIVTEVESAHRYAVTKETQRLAKKRDEPAQIQIESVPGLTELAAAERFVNEISNECLYNNSIKKWHVWNGKIWKIDERNIIQNKCWKFVKGLYADIGKYQSRGERNDYLSDVERLNTKRGVDNIISLAGYKLTRRSEDFNTDIHILCLQNGTIEFKESDFIFREHRKEDMCSQICGCDYDPSAGIPDIWIDHIKKVSSGDDGLAVMIQDALGYTVNGGNPLEVLELAYGSGRNGKSVTLRAIGNVLGDYAVNVNPLTLMESGNQQYSPERMKMRDKRLIIAQEPKRSTDAHLKETGVLDSEFLKSVSGKDKISTRLIRSNVIEEFVLSGVVILSTNNLPTVKDRSVAFWDRLKPMPFDHFFPEEERDEKIEEKMAVVYPGILNWLLDGWKNVSVNKKIRLCEASEAVITEYRCQDDEYAGFITDCVTECKGMTTTAEDLYQSYEGWRKAHGGVFKSATSFGSEMSARFSKKRTKNGILYKDIQINTGQQYFSSGGVR